MESVRERDVHGVDLGVREERVVRPVRARDAVLRGIRLGTSRVARGDGDDLERCVVGARSEYRLVDLGR
jgi:hypothetical protein